MNWWIKKN